MHLERLHPTHPLLSQVRALYEDAFPAIERRELAEQARVMVLPDFHMDAFVREEQLLGIIFYWQTADFIYLEHFATCSHLRGQGLGAQALTLLKDKGLPVLLDIEIPVDTLTRRRLGFYSRNGFVMNSHRYIMPRYRVEDPALEMKLLSYPATLTEEEFSIFQTYLDTWVAATAK